MFASIRILGDGASSIVSHIHRRSRRHVRDFQPQTTIKVLLNITSHNTFLGQWGTSPSVCSLAHAKKSRASVQAYKIVTGSCQTPHQTTRIRYSSVRACALFHPLSTSFIKETSFSEWSGWAIVGHFDQKLPPVTLFHHEKRNDSCKPNWSFDDDDDYDDYEIQRQRHNKL